MNSLHDIAIKTEGLSIGYKKKVVASDLDLSLRKGMVTALLGKNGVGKSTLLKTMTGMLPPLGGTVRVKGRDIRDYRRRELAKTMALVSTDPGLAGALTVREVVSLGRQPFTGVFDRLDASDVDIVEGALRAAGITHKADSFIGTLSDGERQKAMIARALAQNSEIIIMDEPFSFLDVEGKIELLSLMKKIAGENESAILFSTHDVSQALRMTDRIWMFADKADSKIIIDKTPEELVASGDINLLFKSENIEFDSVQNDFIAK